MISSFFSRTKPINYFVTVGFTVLVYVLANLLYLDFTNNLILLLPKLVTLAVLVLTIFAINPILIRNKLVELNSLTMLFFGLLLASFLPALQYDALIISNFLVLLSINQVLSLKSEKRTKHKIFAAAILIFAASLFNEWALAFLVPLYLGIYAYSLVQIRHWLMPVAAFVAIGLLVAAYCSLTNSFHLLSEYYSFSLNQELLFSNYYGLAGYTIFALLIFTIAMVKLNNRGVGRIVSLRIVSSYIFIGIIVALVSDNFGVHVICYSFFATAVFLSNYIETIRKRRFKEALLIGAITIPLVLVGTYIFNNVSL